MTVQSVAGGRLSTGEGGGVEQILAEIQEATIAAWVERVLDTYIEPHALKSQKNNIANPVGTTIADGLRSLYVGLRKGEPVADLVPAIDGIVRIRAVQDFTPAQAVGFLFELKTLIRRSLAKRRDLAVSASVLEQIDAWVDEAALTGFNVYMSCREQLFKVRLKEFERRTHLITDRAKCPSAMLRKVDEESSENNCHC